jgi:hypothetical protein
MKKENKVKAKDFFLKNTKKKKRREINKNFFGSWENKIPKIKKTEPKRGKSEIFIKFLF